MTQSSTDRWFRRAARAAGCGALLWLAFAAGSYQVVQPPFEPNAASGRLIVLPGIHNTLFHLNGFTEMVRLGLPNFAIDRRRWGLPFFGIRNLRAAQDNRAFAQALASDITALRRTQPEAAIYLMGYSGGGGIAALVLEALPDDVVIDRLLLIAPAISAEFDIDRHAAGNVREFVANFASVKDLQVGWGTRTFGTIDRKYEYSAGYGGFDAHSDKLAQWHWRESDRRFGHFGNHISYLGRRWQREFLLPAIDPTQTRAALDLLWLERRAGTAHD